MRMREIIAPGGLMPPWELPNAMFAISVDKQCQVDMRYYKAFVKRIENLPDIPEVATRVGIEIECENLHSYMPKFFLQTWRIKGDGSLRNGGVEFISPAIKPEDVPYELASIYAWIDWLKASPEFSWRTSIHVHLECLDLQTEQFKNLLLLYLLFESALFQFAHPGRRETNIFCTPITRANFYALEHFMVATTKADLRASLLDINSEIRKYSALNLAHLHDFGTIEFRHLRGTGDMDNVLLWCRLLLRLYDAATTINSAELRSQIANLNTTSEYNQFIISVFGVELAPLLIFPGYAIFMSKSISLVKEILRGNELFHAVKLTEDSGLCQFVTAQRNKEKKDPLAEKEKRPRPPQASAEESTAQAVPVQTLPPLSVADYFAGLDLGAHPVGAATYQHMYWTADTAPPSTQG